MPERLDKIHLMICITAAAAVTLACLIHDVSLFDMALWVSVAIMLFFVLGQVARHYLATQVFPAPGAGPAPGPVEVTTDELSGAEPDGDNASPGWGGDDPLGYTLTSEPAPDSKPDFAPIMEE